VLGHLMQVADYSGIKFGYIEELLKPHPPWVPPPEGPAFVMASYYNCYISNILQLTFVAYFSPN
jgi:hypothetical protein